MTNTLRYEAITGASLTGSDGATNRTYSLSYSNPLIAGFSLIVANTALQYETDFTISSGVITFINATWDNQPITMNYYTSSSSTSPTLDYATTLQLAAIMNIKNDVPEWSVGSSPVKETVGTGDDSTTKFYLDYNNIIAGSYTLYYGATEAAATTLTETTHYSLSKDDGTITLTSAGVTLVSTNNIYAEYSYINISIPDSLLNTIIGRAEQRVDKLVNTTFTDGTASNPSYPSTTEVQDSKGKYDRVYFTNNRPIKDVNSTLASDITAAATTLDVASGDGDSFPETGTIIIGSEIITYTGVSTDTLTGLTRGVADSTAATHDEDDEIHTTVIEISSTDEGSNVSWNALQHDSEVYVDEEQGRIFIYKNTILEDVYVTDIMVPRPDVAQRFRIRYLYGWDAVPVDITRLTLIIAKNMLVKDTVSKSLVSGRNEFSPELLDADETEMNSIITSYKEVKCGNT